MSIRHTTSVILLTLALASCAFAQDQAQGAQPLVLQPGTLLTVRIDQALSSDRNQPGDSFSATLTQPLVAQGIVVAQRGQSVVGKVIDVKKAHGFKGNSELRIALTRLSIVDGQSLPIHTELVTNRGRSSTGRDAGAVVGTTAAGAAIGGIANGGEGAGIGAGIGAAAGIIGVLATKGYATIVYPESLLTFETTNTVYVDTTAAPQAFHVVDPATYAQNAEPQLQPPPREEVVQEVVQRPVVERQVVYEPYPAYPYPYSVYGPCDPYWYPYCYGPSVRIIIGGGRWYRPYYRPYRVYGPAYYGSRYYGPRYHYDHDYDRRVSYHYEPRWEPRRYDYPRDNDRGRRPAPGGGSYGNSGGHANNGGGGHANNGGGHGNGGGDHWQGGRDGRHR